MKRFVFTIVAIVLFFVLSEGAARMVDGVTGWSRDVRVYMPIPKTVDRPAYRSLFDIVEKRCDQKLRVRQADLSIRARPAAVNPGRGLMTPPAAKPDAKQVFIVGSSAAWGDGVEYVETFAGGLVLRLGEGVEVHNAGLFGADSEIVAFWVKSIVDCYHPDVIVALLGSEYFQWQYEQQPTWRHHTHAAAAKRSVAYKFLIRLARRVVPVEAPVAGGDGLMMNRRLTSAQECRLDADYPEPRFFNAAKWQADRDSYLRRFEDRVGDFIRYAQHAGVGVVLTTIPFEYRMCPARFIGQPIALAAPDAGAGRRARHAFEQGLAALREKNLVAATAQFTTATREAPAAPLPWHFLGEAQVAAGLAAAATESFRQARERTVGNLGVALTTNEVLRRVAKDTGVVLVDLAADYAGAYANEWEADDLLRDFCHPNVRGHSRITDQLEPAVAKLMGR